MAIDYNDQRFVDLKNEKESALSQSNKTYDNLMNQSSSYYNNLIEQSKTNADQQAELQNKQNEFTVQKIEQQKQEAEKDYTKEQKGAYQDYMKQNNAYGSSMQKVGQSGLANSGWSETSQSGFYNTYQQRYSQARESYNDTIMNYNNNIKEAELQNSSALMEIYNNAQQQQLQLALESYSVIKDLTLAKQNAYTTLDSEYNNRWRQVENQINQENSFNEQIRQYNLELELKKKQIAQAQANWEKEYALSKASSSSSGSGSYSSSSSGSLTSGSSSGSSDKYGNNSSIQKKSDYYFSNGYQPQYINNQKLSKSGMKVSDVFEKSGSLANQNIWSAGGKYYIWDGSQKDYVEVTDKVKSSKKNKINYRWGL